MVTIRNRHTRRACARACGRFLVWCEDRGITLTVIRSHDLAAWIEQLQLDHSAPSVKQAKKEDSKWHLRLRHTVC